MDSIITLANYLTNHSASLASEVVNEITERFEFHIPEDEIIQAKKMYNEFIVFLADSLDCEEGSVPEVLMEWSKKNGETAAKSGLEISQILMRYPDTRIVFADYMTNLGLEYQLGTQDIVKVIKRVNHILDLSINETVLAFERFKDHLITDAQNEIKELSNPVVPIQDKIAILPLIGKVDADRTDHLLTQVVPRIQQLRIEHLIIDFSGIVNINTEVAMYIFNIHSVFRLLGIDIMVTGIRPELAGRIVHAGIDFTSIKVHGSVKQAIKNIH
ncbi:STAS domain-containing protein [Fictibacillus fluitans]|uniref:STAS domain-containing protein n=1 Tax=Fictibacillus fluitans TaxID=3058422 RepID=A0ABT8HWF9_9BACL|nr:STAS domain-containing protein [Fictibacillus sp. NE201]MDN4524597.1 STAS domain-containing protein [Fictibacillus sp. NE201]